MKVSTKRKIRGASKSKTVLANAAVVAGAAIDMVATNGAVIAALGPWGPLGLGLLNMVLRSLTEESLESKGL